MNREDPTQNSQYALLRYYDTRLGAMPSPPTLHRPANKHHMESSVSGPQRMVVSSQGPSHLLYGSTPRHQRSRSSGKQNVTVRPVGPVTPGYCKEGQNSGGTVVPQRYIPACAADAETMRRMEEEIENLRLENHRLKILLNSNRHQQQPGSYQATSPPLPHVLNGMHPRNFKNTEASNYSLITQTQPPFSTVIREPSPSMHGSDDGDRVSTMKCGSRGLSYLPRQDSQTPSFVNNNAGDFSID